MKDAVLSKLQAGPASFVELKEGLHCRPARVREAIKSLQRDQLIHIVEWRRTAALAGRQYRAVYKAGAGVDAPPIPAGFTVPRKLEAHRDPLVAAFFGSHGSTVETDDAPLERSTHFELEVTPWFNPYKLALDNVE